MLTKNLLFLCSLCSFKGLFCNFIKFWTRNLNNNKQTNKQKQPVIFMYKYVNPKTLL